MNLITILLILTITQKSHENLECVSKILNHYISKSESIFINLQDLTQKNFNNSFLTIFQNIPLRNINFYDLKKRPFEIWWPKFYKYPATIYVHAITENFTQEIQSLHAIHWEEHAKFIFITNSNLNLQQLNQFLKEIFIRNFIFIRNGQIFGWDFFDLALAYNSTPLNLSSFGMCSNLFNLSGLFPKKFYGNFNFLQVRACHMEKRPFAFSERDQLTNATRRIGIEVNLLQLLGQLLNLTITYVHSPHPDIYSAEDLDHENVLRILGENKTDIFFGR